MSDRRPTLDYQTPGIDLGREAMRFQQADKVLTAWAVAIVVIVLLICTVSALAIH